MYAVQWLQCCHQSQILTIDEDSIVAVDKNVEAWDNVYH